MNKQPTSRSCILCGRENSIGLRMNWYNDREAQKVIGQVVIPETFNNGYTGLTHGGMVAALLDETAIRATWINGDFDNVMTTKDLQINYRRPTPTNTTLTVTGWVIEQTETTAVVASMIQVPDGTVTAEGKATAVKLPDHFRNSVDIEADRKYWRVE
ncbi:MAG: PaaI family thioesterase [Syntrophomonadales bacterium]|jgi:uncharacterized protein (TIGR00369 family)